MGVRYQPDAPARESVKTSLARRASMDGASTKGETMLRKQFCGSPEHSLDRRLFLQGGIATALGVSLAGLEAPLHAAAAAELGKKKRQVLLLWLAGGSSQLETWDPKPGRPTG